MEEFAISQSTMKGWLTLASVRLASAIIPNERVEEDSATSQQESLLYDPLMILAGHPVLALND